MNLITSLRQLAADGRAVITTIHQPSSRLYQQLDKLLLLSDGHLMYYGGSTFAQFFSFCAAYQSQLLLHLRPQAFVLEQWSTHQTPRTVFLLVEVEAA